MRRNPLKQASETQMAAEADVSLPTLRRFISGKGGVSEAATKRITAVYQKHGRSPHVHTWVKMHKKTQVLGILTSHYKDFSDDPYHRGLLKGIAESIKEEAKTGVCYDLRIIFMEDEDYANIQEVLKEKAIDGLMILTWRMHPKIVKLAQSCPKNFPVLLFNDFDKTVPANFVFCDVGLGTEMQVDRFVKIKRTKIAYLRGPSLIYFQSGEKTLMDTSLDSKEKFEGFKRAMARHKLPVREAWVKECGAYSRSEGYQKTIELLHAKELPNAIACANDGIAMGALDALLEKEIPCPKQIAVIGFDGINLGEHTKPPLTTIDQQLETMGKVGGHHLIGVACGKLSDPLQTNILPQLVLRGSA